MLDRFSYLRRLSFPVATTCSSLSQCSADFWQKLFVIRPEPKDKPAVGWMTGLLHHKSRKRGNFYRFRKSAAKPAIAGARTFVFLAQHGGETPILYIWDFHDIRQRTTLWQAWEGSLCNVVDGICGWADADIEQVQAAREMYARTPREDSIPQ